MSREVRKSVPTKYGPSKAIPGQALKPSDLMKRHMAGTLPDIDLARQFEYHYDSDGKQIGEPLPLEMHEIHALAAIIKQRQWDQAVEARKRQAERLRDEIIEEYKKSLPEGTKLVPKADQVPGEPLRSPGADRVEPL